MTTRGDSNSAATKGGFIATLLWGLFCANSWTWCIGMLLPALMLQRWGWPGFLVFAAPNVLGCAAFGYVVRTPERSAELVARHAPAMTWFSIVTVAYHVFFIVLLFSELAPLASEPGWRQSVLPLAAAAVVFGIGVVLAFLPDRDWLVLTAAVYALGLLTFVSIGTGPLQRIQWTGTEPAAALIWLAPTIVFGFVLCPYLDLTFHRAVQRSPSRHAFSVFGVAFPVMLLLTVAIWMPRGVIAWGGILSALALAHLLAQSVFTCGAHLREIRISSAISDRGRRLIAMVAPLAAAPLLAITHSVARDGDASAVGEQLYLRFLVFYGLVFPAYALLMMRVRRPGSTARLHPLAFAALVLLSLPAYEYGFIGGKTWLLVIPLAVILVVRVLSRKRPFVLP